MSNHSILNAPSDHYPFGMMMLGRSWSSESGYRFGFASMEILNEINGDLTIIDFGARTFDVRLGRWTKVDPLSHVYHYYARGWCPHQPHFIGKHRCV